MGLFDYILDEEARCDNCHAALYPLQTKDTNLPMLDRYVVGHKYYELRIIRTLSAYTTCENCGWWTTLEYKVTRGGKLKRTGNVLESRETSHIPWTQDLEKQSKLRGLLGSPSESVRTVYISGPYTNGSPEENVRKAVEAGNAILDAGHAPFVPHLLHYWHTLHGERHYEDWMRIDLAFVPKCDYLLRLPGESPGADREVELAKEAGVTVYWSTHLLLGALTGDN